MTVCNSKAKYIVLNEVNIVSQAIRRSSGRYHSRQHAAISGDEYDDLIPHMKGFIDLKKEIAAIQNLSNLEPFRFVQPFLEVIRADDVNGPITSLALSSINKFLSYGLISATSMASPSKTTDKKKKSKKSAGSESITEKSKPDATETDFDNQSGAWRAIEAIADALRNARFVGTEPKEDEVVLMKILQVSRTLILTPIGQYLSNDSVCYIMQSCFRICFEMRLSELLRRSAEQSLIDMVQLLFTRLPNLEDDDVNYAGYDKPGALGYTTVEETQSIISGTEGSQASPVPEQSTPNESEEAQAMLSNVEGQQSEGTEGSEPFEKVGVESGLASPTKDQAPQLDFTNPQGVRFTAEPSDAVGPTEQHQPYGITAVRDLLVFLVSLLDLNGEKEKRNSDVMVRIGLSLIQVALEVSRDSIIEQPTLLTLVQDEMCLYLYQILSSDKVNLVSQALNVNLLLFESLRMKLKFQLEAFLQRLLEISCMNDGKVFIPLEIREMALEQLNTVLAIPGFPVELYLNYDCDFYCSNLLEDIVTTLSKSSFLNYSSQAAGQPGSGQAMQYQFMTATTQALCMETLLGIVDGIEHRCLMSEKPEMRAADTNTPRRFASARPSVSELRQVKNQKAILTTATEKFNEKPKKGISYMIEHNMLEENDLKARARWLRDNPDLDKRQIGEYISRRDATDILNAYVASFDWANQRLDQSLRAFLEAFRLPGEAPVISKLIESFSEHWMTLQPTDTGVNSAGAGYTLAFAIVMLNTDQHNKNVAKTQVPMSEAQFKKNLRGCNEDAEGKQGPSFGDEMLSDIYHAIKQDEIVLPHEQKGAVRDQYIWKQIMKRLDSDEGKYISIVDDSPKAELPPTDEELEKIRQNTQQGLQEDSYEKELFSLVWEPTITSLSQTFQARTVQDNQKTISGFKKCAMLAARFSNTDIIDRILLDLGRFSHLISNNDKLSYVTGKIISKSTVSTAPAGGAQEMGEDAVLTTQGSVETVPEGRGSVGGAETATGESVRYRQLNTIEICEQAVLKFSTSEKAQHAAKTLFTVARRHGNSLTASGGWKILLEAYLTLYRAQVFPEKSSLSQSEDFSTDGGFSAVIPDLKVRRLQSFNENQGFLSSFFGMGNSGTANDGSKILTRDQIGVLERLSTDVVPELEVDSIVQDSKFLRLGSIQELTKAITELGAHRGDSALFYLELFIQIILKNKDRAGTLWQCVRQYFAGILLETRKEGVEWTKQDHLLVERAVTGLIRIAIRLGPCSPPVAKIGFETLQLVLLIPPHAIAKLQNPIAIGLQELIRTQSANIHRRQDWFTILQLLMYACLGKAFEPAESKLAIVKRLGRVLSSASEAGQMTELMPEEQLRIEPNAGIPSNEVDPTSLTTSISAIELLIRANAVNVSPVNFPLLVDCLTSFNQIMRHGKVKVSDPRQKEGRRRSSEEQHANSEVTFDHLTVSLKLVDLMASLHSKAAPLYRSTNARYAVELEDGERLEERLWTECWEPLLVAISRACCDSRKQLRTQALTSIQRALHACDMQKLNYIHWIRCFENILFPLVQTLIQPDWTVLPHNAPAGAPRVPPPSSDLEETRIRAMNLLTKVFLQHLAQIIQIPDEFTRIWLQILDFMDRYINIGRGETLAEAIPESLKNVLLVMDTQQVFGQSGAEPATRVISSDPNTKDLWSVTWQRISKFLPKLHTSLYNIPPTPHAHLTAPAVQTVMDRQTNREVPTLANSHQSPSLARGDQLQASAAFDQIAAQQHSNPLLQNQAVMGIVQIGDPSNICPEFPESSVRTNATQLPVNQPQDTQSPSQYLKMSTSSNSLNAFMANSGDPNSTSITLQTGSILENRIPTPVSDPVQAGASSLLDTGGEQLESAQAPVVLLDPNILTAIQDLNNTLASVNLGPTQTS